MKKLIPLLLFFISIIIASLVGESAYSLMALMLLFCIYYYLIKPIINGTKKASAKIKEKHKEKQKERTAKWLESEDGQAYLQNIDDIYNKQEELTNTIIDIGNRIEQLKKDTE